MAAELRVAIPFLIGRLRELIKTLEELTAQLAASWKAESK